MKQISIYLSIISLSFIGCGPSGSSNSINLDSNSTKKINGIDIKVERGAVFMSTVTDTDGQVAFRNNLGFSNIYTFKTQPKYPIYAKGGYIDINGDGKLSRKDDKRLDIDMLSYSNVISPLTTLVGDNNISIEYLNREYNISRSDIFDKVPSKTSIETILFSNIAYIAIKNGYSIKSDEFKESVTNIKEIYNQKFADIKDLTQLSIALEEELLKDKKSTDISTDEINSIQNSVSNHNITPTTDTNSGSSQQPYTPFVKEYKSSDTVSNIWNFIIKAPINKDINSFDIGVTLVRNSDGTKGFILIKGINLKGGAVTSISSVKVFGIKPSGSTGSIAYGSSNPITQNAVSVIQGDSILVNLGEIMQNQTIVSEKSFKRVSKYDVNLYISKVNIEAPVVGSFSFQTDYDEYYTFNSDTRRLNGTINIKNN